MISLLQPIPQDQSYHRFADVRMWLATPNAADVFSNVAFVIVGIVGLFWLARRAVPQRWMWMTFFGGVTLVGFGSAYYHLNPIDATLVWDRLPMTIAFMSFFAALLAERCNERVGTWLFVPLLAFGIGSVVYWRYTDDLRWYGVVQYGPMLAIPMLLLTRPPRYLRTSDVWIVLASYAAAKVFERFDAPLLSVLGVSGHTLKHVAAAAGCGWVLRALRR
ncbi:MAG: alkaline phytoceramidase [Verrucomicrobia bacterium]|nr:alkaline phytoceramidase [Verrucomicrobiota bacterium]